MLMTAVKTDDATAVAAVPPREFLSTLGLDQGRRGGQPPAPRA